MIVCRRCNACFSPTGAGCQDLRCPYCGLRAADHREVFLRGLCAVTALALGWALTATNWSEIMRPGGGPSITYALAEPLWLRYPVGLVSWALTLLAGWSAWHPGQERVGLAASTAALAVLISKCLEALPTGSIPYQWVAGGSGLVPFQIVLAPSTGVAFTGLVLLAVLTSWLQSEQQSRFLHQIPTTSSRSGA